MIFDNSHNHANDAKWDSAAIKQEGKRQEGKNTNQ